MRDDLDEFFPRHTIFERTLNVKRELLRAVHCHKCGHRGKTTIPLRESRPLPNISEKDVFGQIRKFRCDVTNSFVYGCASFLIHRYSRVYPSYRSGREKSSLLSAAALASMTAEE